MRRESMGTYITFRIYTWWLCLAYGKALHYSTRSGFVCYVWPWQWVMCSAAVLVDWLSEDNEALSPWGDDGCCFFWLFGSFMLDNAFLILVAKMVSYHTNTGLYMIETKCMPNDRLCFLPHKGNLAPAFIEIRQTQCPVEDHWKSPRYQSVTSYLFPSPLTLMWNSIDFIWSYWGSTASVCGKCCGGIVLHKFLFVGYLRLWTCACEITTPQ